LTGILYEEPAPAFIVNSAEMADNEALVGAEMPSLDAGVESLSGRLSYKQLSYLFFHQATSN
jgi:hypothetical protein